MTIHIKVLGDWTANLHQLVSEKNGVFELTAYMEGPYGAPEIDIDSDDYRVFMLVSGGIGATPLQSVCQHLVHLATTGQRDIAKVGLQCGGGVLS